MVLPPALKKGDTIGVMAPSAALNEFDRRKLRRAVKMLEKAGFRVLVHPQTFMAARGNLAGTSWQKTNALHDLYRNPAVKAIFAAAGGYGAMGMLDKLDYRLIASHPKILMGYSDVTALLDAVSAKTGITTFHGPTMDVMGKHLPPQYLAQCFSLLAGKPASVPGMDKARTLTPGTASGRLVGGNLSLFSKLAGTPGQPPLKDALLFLEDTNEDLSSHYILLENLRNKGVFNQLAGIVFGSFAHTTGLGDKRFGGTIKNMIKTLTGDLNIPVIFDAPFGHGRKLCTLPVGGHATLRAEAGKPPSLTLDGPAVRL